jgi:2-polyprenyl-3-methyl-5-hydroxy-6-metoxy-1,4-benzoquinol methylase
LESNTVDKSIKDNQTTKNAGTNLAVILEENRLKNVSGVDDYNMIHERHRIFPALFENRNHKRILDISAGVGIVADRIKNKYPADLLCNDLSPKALSILRENGHKTISFDLDQDKEPYPLENEQFDAVISLATIEHILDIDHFLSEIRRILKESGYLYISAPNYSGLTYLLPFIFSGKTFHDPLNKNDKYEFYAHVRYFTYRTLIEVVSQCGFETAAVYIGKPSEGSRYLNLKRKSPLKAKIFKLGMSSIYKLFSPRWAAEPVICFKKTKDSNLVLKPRKIIL